MTIRSMLMASRTGGLLQADAAISAGTRQVIEVQSPLADATVIWYKIGDASGRGGEVWALLATAGDSKLGDWLVPNDAGIDAHIQFSNLVGDTPTGWSTSWQRIGGTGSGNVSLQQQGTFEADFDVDIGRDGSTSVSGPAAWGIEADSS